MKRIILARHGECLMNLQLAEKVKRARGRCAAADSLPRAVFTICATTTILSPCPNAKQVGGRANASPLTDLGAKQVGASSRPCEQTGERWYQCPPGVTSLPSCDRAAYLPAG
jgi:hypothetical protein